MNENSRTKASKFLSFVLRHRPDSIGIQLDEHGWVQIDELLQQCRANGTALLRAELDEIVVTSPKQRFAIQGDRIRANQGHSVPVDLAHPPADPPDVLFHGTVARALPAIRTEGLRRMNRHHVHLSAEQVTAENVGRRRGKPVILQVDAAGMCRRGYAFYLSDNGVWLTEWVPSQFILGMADT